MQKKINIRLEKIVEDCDRTLDMNEEERIEYNYGSKYRFLEILKLIPPQRPNSRILELGAGRGFLTHLLKKWCKCHVHALDIKVQVRRHIKANEIDYVKCNIEKERFPFRNKVFDHVICSEVLEHLVYSPPHMLKEVHRVLKDSGHLILTTPNCANLSRRLRLLFGKNVYPDYHTYYKSSLYRRHNREYTVAEVKKLLTEHGFVIENAFYKNYGPGIVPPGMLTKVVRMLYRVIQSLYPPFKALIIVKGRKIKRRS